MGEEVLVIKNSKNQKALNQNRVIRNKMIFQPKVKFPERIKNKTIIIKNLKGEAEK